MTVPTRDYDPVLYPLAVANLTDATSKTVISAAIDEILTIINATNTGLSSNCSKCVAALSIGQMVAKLAPTYLPQAMVALCQTTKFSSNLTCQSTYEAGSYGATWTQILAHADVAGLDGRFICNSLSSTFCSTPGVTSGKAKFPRPKPERTIKPAASGKRVKVLHFSDIHLGELTLTIMSKTLTEFSHQIPDMKQVPRRIVVRACVVAIQGLQRMVALQLSSSRLPFMATTSAIRPIG